MCCTWPPVKNGVTTTFGWTLVLDSCTNRAHSLNAVGRLVTVLHMFRCFWSTWLRIRSFRPDPARKLSANLYEIYRCCVYNEKLMMDRGTVRKPVEFYSKNKFEKLVHLIGFIIRIYNYARSPERQIHM